jgi:hypothetical protein
MRKTFFATLLLAICPFIAAQQALNNDSVIKLVKAGLSDDLIITTINASPGTFDTSANGLIALKRAKVSDKVVAAIVVKANGGGQPGGAGPGGPQSGFSPTATMGAGGLPQGIDDVGVYLRDKSGAWVPLLPEIVVFESSGKLKNIASDTSRAPARAPMQAPPSPLPSTCRNPLKLLSTSCFTFIPRPTRGRFFPRLAECCTPMPALCAMKSICSLKS